MPGCLKTGFEKQAQTRQPRHNTHWQTADASTMATPPPPASVVVHPLVLLSVVDHYHRAARDTRKRVVGFLLGERTGTGAGVTVDVTNSFAGGWGIGEQEGGA